ncbi:FAD-dependent oxidoreductase [Chloroflexota bacterium]
MVPNKFREILQPFSIREVKLRNRIICPAHVRMFATKDGYATKETVASYETLAKGGVGLIVLETTTVSFDEGYIPGYLQMGDDRYIPDVSKVVDAVHGAGCPIFLQLCHAGPRHQKSYYGIQPATASALDDSQHPLPGSDPTREMPLSEVEDIIVKFVDAAERASKAGFNGVEIHAAHHYLLNTFLSRAWNKRQDAYGCQNLESRARIVVEIIKKTKERLGNDFPLGVRLNGKEWGHPEGITPEESQAFAKMFEQAGADYLSVSAYGYGSYQWIQQPEHLMYPEPEGELKRALKRLKKPGLLVPPAIAIKEIVSVPVVAVGRLYPELGEWLLQKKKVDLIGMVKRLIADPELPNKLMQDRYEDIRWCMGCVECTGKLANKEPVRCRVNASLGQELEYVIKPATKKKKITVVGGGPAGMEAARVAALRGHEVTLYEKEHILGGLLPLLGMVKGTEIDCIALLIRYYQTQFGKLGVRVVLDRTVTPSLITETKPDAVVIATGGMPDVPEIPDIGQANLTSSSDLHRQAKVFLRFLGPRLVRWLTRFWMPIGRQVTIIGGQIQGAQLAEFLARRGRKVVVLEASAGLADGVPGRLRPRLLNWLTEKGVRMLAEVRYEEATGKGLVITTKEGQKETITADTMLSGLPLKPNTELAQALEGKVPEVHAIGDCHQSGKVIDAVDDGMRVGLAL